MSILIQNDLTSAGVRGYTVDSHKTTIWQWLPGQPPGRAAGHPGRGRRPLPYLVQIPGISLINGMTILGAIGDIKRFPSAKKLVGYAGLGARVSQSGTRCRTGSITKARRKDLRHAMVEAAHSAARTHPRWQEELKRLEPRLGRKKALVAIARKLLVAVWNILYYQQADRYASPKRVAAALHLLAYCVKVRNLPEKSAAQYVRNQLDRLGIGQDLEYVPWGSKKVKLPPSLP